MGKIFDTVNLIIRNIKAVYKPEFYSGFNDFAGSYLRDGNYLQLL